jgi:hypothetical protein
MRGYYVKGPEEVSFALKRKSLGGARKVAVLSISQSLDHSRGVLPLDKTPFTVI